MGKHRGPKILAIDIETAPLEVYTWGIYEQNVGLNQIKEDWSVLAVCARWLGGKAHYWDQRHAKHIRHDEKLIRKVWQLLDEADIVLTQNGRRFDVPKLNARFAAHGMKPPSSYQQIDTRQLARKRFGFTSNSLEYLAKILKCKHQKLTNRKYAGQDLWTACLKRDMAAWREMERYNKQDVLVLEEVYDKLKPWGVGINLALYSPGNETPCTCGKTSWIRYGRAYTSTGVYQRFQCRVCGTETRGRENLLSKGKRRGMKVGTQR